MAIHDFDMARFLIDSEVSEIYAVAGVLVDEAIGAVGDVDTAVTLLKFANGVIGSIDNSRSAAYGYDQRVEILGSAGMVGTDNNYPSTAVISDGRSVHRDLPLNFFMERYTQSYLTEMTAFVNTALDGGQPAVTAADGRQAVALALGVLTLLGVVSPWLLLILTFSLGAGSALVAPTWAALFPDVVSRAQVPTAISMSSAGYNIARAVGPAIGGFVLAVSGPAATFLLN